MRLTLTEEQALVETSARDFLAAEYDFTRRQRSVEAPHGCNPQTWRQFAELGWLGLLVPEDCGGSGVGLFEAGLLMRAFGRHLVVEPFVASALVATPLLAQARRDAQVAELPAGRGRAAFAHEELAAPWPLGARATTARRIDSGWHLQGSKQLVPGAAGADWLLVTARVSGGREQPAQALDSRLRANDEMARRTSGSVIPAQAGTQGARQRIGCDGDPPGEHRIFLLPTSTTGLRVTPVRTADSRWAADVAIDDVRLPEDAALGGDSDIRPLIERACATQLIAQCWEASGAMAALLEQTTAYVQQRVQFGKPLAEFQVVQHRLAEMAVACEEALAACELAALRFDAGDVDVMALASMAKSKVGRESRFVAQNAVQLHGAMGVTEELAVASWFRKLTAFAQQGGSTAAHSRAFGSTLLRDAGWSHSRTLGALEPA